MPTTNTPNQDRAPIKIIRLKAVMEMTGLPRSSVYRLADDGEFPRSIKLSKRNVGWLASEVEAWLQEKIDNRLKG